VTIIDRTNHHLFQPLLYQMAAVFHLARHHRRVALVAQWLTPGRADQPALDDDGRFRAGQRWQAARTAGADTRAGTVQAAG
jgi:hypothetical protein